MSSHTPSFDNLLDLNKKYREDLQRMEVENSELNAMVTSKSIEINNMLIEKQAYLDEKTQLVRDNSDLQKELIQLRGQVKELRSNLDESDKAAEISNKNTKEELRQLRIDSELLKRSQDFEKKFKNLQIDYETLKEQKTKFEQKYHETRLQLFDMQRKLEEEPEGEEDQQKKVRFSQKSQQVEQEEEIECLLKKERDSHEEHVAKLKAELKDFKTNKIPTLESMVKRFKQAEQDQNKAINMYQRQIEALESQLREERQNHKDARVELREFKRANSGSPINSEHSSPKRRPVILTGASPHNRAMKQMFMSKYFFKPEENATTSHETSHGGGQTQLQEVSASFTPRIVSGSGRKGSETSRRRCINPSCNGNKSISNLRLANLPDLKTENTPRSRRIAARRGTHEASSNVSLHNGSGSPRTLREMNRATNYTPTSERVITTPNRRCAGNITFKSLYLSNQGDSDRSSTSILKKLIDGKSKKTITFRD